MTSQLVKERATNSSGVISQQRGLSLCEINIGGLWSIRSSASHDLNGFARSVFDQDIKFGEMITFDNLRLIQLWPQAAYLITADNSLPDTASEFETLITDIGHGFCDLNLSGEGALVFLNDHSSVDLNQQNISINRTVRTSLGHFQILLWWDEATDIHILVDRSYAQSFADYLAHLADRWCDRDLPPGKSNAPSPMINSASPANSNKLN
jgi:hypothetical protein